MAVEKTLTLSGSGHTIPTVGLGVYLIPLDITAAIVEQALEVGYRHLDCARIYGNEAETAEGIANYLAKNPHVDRSDIFYTTKIWPNEFGYDRTKAAVEDSFDEVKHSIGYIDLILLHSPESTSQKRLESYRALQDAQDAGITKNIGVSSYGVHHLRELLSWPQLKHHPTVNQIEVNPWLQHDDIAKFCQAHDIVVEAYSPLMFGGRLHDPAIVRLAEKYQRTPAQILLRWNLQKGYVPLPKTVHLARIKENFEVFDWTIDDKDVEELGDVSAKFLASPGEDPTEHP